MASWAACCVRPAWHAGALAWKGLRPKSFTIPCHYSQSQLQGKTDQKFVENAFRLFRDCFAIKTVLTPAHFLDQVGHVQLDELFGILMQPHGDEHKQQQWSKIYVAWASCCASTSLFNAACRALRSASCCCSATSSRPAKRSITMRSERKGWLH